MVRVGCILRHGNHWENGNRLVVLNGKCMAARFQPYLPHGACLMPCSWQGETCTEALLHVCFSDRKKRCSMSSHPLKPLHYKHHLSDALEVHFALAVE